MSASSRKIKQLQRELIKLDARRANISAALDVLAPTHSDVTPTSPTVLVVHRNAEVRNIQADALTEAGFEVITAADGTAALTLLADERYIALAAVEAEMTDLDAFELVQAMHVRRDVREVPFVLLGSSIGSTNLSQGLGGVEVFALDDSAGLVTYVTRTVADDRRVQAAIPALLSTAAFERACRREILRSSTSDAKSTLAVLRIFEGTVLRNRLGPSVARELYRQVGLVLRRQLGLLDALTVDATGTFSLLLGESTTVSTSLREMTRALVRRTFLVSGLELHITPAIGFVALKDTATPKLARRRAGAAAEVALGRNDLEAVAFSPDMAVSGATLRQRLVARPQHILLKLRTPFQILLSFALGGGLPFLIYVLLDRIGYDITAFTYPIIVIALVLAAILILVEGLAALPSTKLPKFSGEYPPASAIIAAYLPNEAATILQTIAAFRALDYPNLQIILAYNTPRDLPVEALLRAVSARDSRLVLLRVDTSISKAQNVNAALDVATGKFIGIFDADHHPEAGSFQRAWAWIAGGYDVVQGHNVVRNGASTLVSRIVAVEFESTYAVGHPGRNRLHGFGIFGGSNGYWEAGLLRQTRMRAGMLTEDIDSSMRALASGHRIASDRGLISRELAPTTVRALWDQRARWAQGWYQVSIRHTLGGLRSPNLSLRNKLGLLHLLAWREGYPWLSVQVFPIIAFWLLSEHRTLNWLVPIWVLTTLFTLSIGPLQVLFSYWVADTQIRRHRTWFLLYLVASAIFYTEFKNVITRVSQIKEFMGERSWRVTPRALSKSTSDVKSDVTTDVKSDTTPDVGVV